jgi:hypothetical protein
MPNHIDSRKHLQIVGIEELTGCAAFGLGVIVTKNSAELTAGDRIASL